MQKPRNIVFALNAAALLLSASGLVLWASTAKAQLAGVPDPVQYTVSPQTPGPGQQVTISVEGVGSFIGDSTITWIQGGKTVRSGVGETNFSFTTGALGSKTSVQVQIVSPTSGTFAHDFTFQPSLVNLVWEADTTAPPLYRGKPLYSGGSNLKIVAFPSVYVNGLRVASNNLSMQWFYDDNSIPQQSGLGRTTFSFAGDQLQQAENVAVDAYYGASKVAHSEISIPASQPLLVLYGRDPLRGVLYDTALPAAISLGASELTVQAVPYYFSNSSAKNLALSYQWTLDGNEVTGPESGDGILTLRKSGVGQGAAEIGVTLQNNDSDKFVQTANAALQIIFGQSDSNSIFGL